MEDNENYPKKRLIILFIIIIGLIIGGYTNLFTKAEKIFINGEYVGIATEELVLSKTYEEDGVKITKQINSQITKQEVWVKKTKTSNAVNLEQFYTYTYEIYEFKVGESIFYFKNEGECATFQNKLIDENENVETNFQKITTDTLEQLTSLEAQEQEIENQKVTSRSYVERAIPTTSKILSSYTYISSRYRSASRPNHTGVDYAAPTGTPVYSWKSGTITMASWYGSYGNTVIIDHGNGEVTRYAHLDKITCQVGQQVIAGYQIGTVGSTGNSTGPHLHFELLINGSFVNPELYL